MTNPLYDPYAVLFKVYSGGAYLKQALADTPVEEANRPRTTRICYGVLENDLYLERCVKTFAAKNPKLPVRILLKIALYLLLYMGKKKYMVTDNAVSLVKKLGKGGAAGFLNAFLRAFDEKKVGLPEGEISSLSVRYSYPEFAVRLLLSEYGREEAVRIMEARPAGITVRFAGADSAQKYLSRVTDAVETPFENVWIFPSFRRDEGYDAGEYTFQSVGSVAICGGVEACDDLLDACAAPGGKSVLLAEKCARVTAFELHPHRAKLIEAYARRMHAENIRIVCRDSSLPDEAYRDRFDAVLVDAPCSGFGVAAENPDIRLFRKEADLAPICEAQKKILSACARYVKKGGFLYYSTCSVFGCENDGTVSSFLEANGEFSVMETDSPLGHVRKKFGLQFLPHLSRGAGFYFCKMRRKST